MEDFWITTAEAAQISGFHIEYVRRLIRKGTLRARKWGREWMIDRESLLHYLSLDNRPGPKSSDVGLPKL